jgi:hypothetical protein
MTIEPILTIDQAAKICHVSRNTIKNRLADGTLRGTKKLGRWIIDGKFLQEFLTREFNRPKFAESIGRRAG